MLALGSVLALGCLGFVVDAASGRTPGFSKPFSLGHADGGVGPDAAIDDRGDMIVAWAGSARGGGEGIRIAFRSAHGRFSRARTIFTTHHTVDDLGVAIDGGGNALVVFTDSTLDRNGSQVAASVRVIYRAARGGLGKTQTLSPPGSDAQAPAVAMAGSGEAVVVFQRDLQSLRRHPYPNPVVMAALRAPGHRFAPASLISPPGAFFPSVTMAAGGEAVAAWQRGEHSPLQTSVRPPGGAFEPAQPIGSGSDYPPMLAGDRRGDAVLAWSNIDSSGLNTPLSASYRQAGGSFSSPQVIEPDLSGAGEFSVAIDPLGVAAVARLATDPNDCSGGILRISRGQRGGGFTLPQQVWRAASDPNVAAYGSGRFMTSFQEIQANPDSGPDHSTCGTAGEGLADATASTAAAFGPAHRFARPAYAYSPSLVASPSGLVLAAWEVLDSTQTIVTVRASVLGARPAPQR